MKGRRSNNIIGIKIKIIMKMKDEIKRRWDYTINNPDEGDEVVWCRVVHKAQNDRVESNQHHKYLLVISAQQKNKSGRGQKYV
jgi:hypothetical protein